MSCVCSYSTVFYNIQLSKNNIRQVAYEVLNIRHSPTQSSIIRQKVGYFDSPCRRSTRIDILTMDNRQMSRFVDTFRLHSAISGILQPKPWGRLAYLVEYGVFKEHFDESSYSPTKCVGLYHLTLGTRTLLRETSLRPALHVPSRACVICVCVCRVRVVYDSTIGMFG